VISDKAVEHVLDADDHVVEREVEDERRTAPSLSDDEIRAVAALARRAERHYGRPQDVEWAIDPALPADNNVVLLQSRPETVWSCKKREIPGASADTFTSIVHNLLHPSGTQTVHLH
jgi:pyruvate,water dikinase